MKKRILLTSFDTWLPHHKSNSSDDLLIEVAKVEPMAHDFTFLRLLPVDVKLASSRVIEKIQESQPDAVLCCGMAESRRQLSLEKNANWEESVLQTTIDLEKLVAGVGSIQISHDCGKFVCEGLYYSVLDYLHRFQLTGKCIFVHVPILTAENSPGLLADFLLVIHRVALS